MQHRDTPPDRRPFLTLRIPNHIHRLVLPPVVRAMQEAIIDAPPTGLSTADWTTASMEELVTAFYEGQKALLQAAMNTFLTLSVNTPEYNLALRLRLYAQRPSNREGIERKLISMSAHNLLKEYSRLFCPSSETSHTLTKRLEGCSYAEGPTSTPVSNGSAMGALLSCLRWVRAGFATGALVRGRSSNVG